MIQAVDEEERTLLQGQRVGPGAIGVRQMAVMRFDDVAEGDRLGAPRVLHMRFVPGSSRLAPRKVAMRLPLFS